MGHDVVQSAKRRDPSSVPQATSRTGLQAVSDGIQPLDLCILVVTHPQAIKVAEYTIGTITQRWEDHPPILMCGAEPFQSSIPTLPLRSDPRNWIGIALDAAEELLSRGFKLAYIILDDQFPVGRCHANHLNRTIPEMAIRHDAANIALYGYGQCRHRLGEVIEPRCGLERLPTDYHWRFALHPMLWNLERFRDHLAFVIRQSTPPLLPWQYETECQRLGAQVPPQIGERCHRIDGLRMTANRGASVWSVLHRSERAIADAVIALTQMLGTERSRRIRGVLEMAYQYYEGPYPYYWSGGLVKGRLNMPFARWARLHGRATAQTDLAELRRLAPLKG